MTVILGFMAVGIALSLFVAHLASALSARILERRQNRDFEMEDRLARDQTYARLFSGGPR